MTVGITQIEADLQGAEGAFAVTVVADGTRGQAAQTKMITMPKVCLGDPPSADRMVICRPVRRPYLGAMR